MELLRSPEQVPDALMQGIEFYIPKEKAEQLQDLARQHPKDAMKTGVLLVKRRNVKSKFPTNRLAQETVPYFLFGNQTQLYGDWLSELGITIMPQGTIGSNYAKQQERPFSCALWVGSLGNNSGLYAGAVIYISYGRVRGVREVPAEERVLTIEKKLV